MSPLTVGVIGAGRVGAVLGAALVGAGHRVVAASGVSEASRERIGRLLPGAANLPADEVARAATDLLIISVPDDALAGVVAGLAGTGAIRPGQVVAHTSGAHGLAVLAPATLRGARPLALHPAMTFTGHRDDLRRLVGASFGVTAPDELRPFATQLAADLAGQGRLAGGQEGPAGGREGHGRLAGEQEGRGGPAGGREGHGRPAEGQEGRGAAVEWVAEDDRPLYHAALAHGANHLVTLVNEALDRLRDAGVAHPDKVLGPLLEAALHNALRLGDAALTGPVSRGDAGTVAQHLDRLAATAPESVPPYLALARRTADRAIASGRLRPLDAGPLLDVLATRTRTAA